MVVINLRTNSGYPQQTAAINTDIQFPTAVGNTVPNTCSLIIESAKTAGNKQAFMEQYKLLSMLDNINTFYHGLTSSGVNQLDTLEVNATIVSGAGDYNAYLQTIEQSQLPIQRLVAHCLQESSVPDPTDLQAAEKRLEVSKARYELISPDSERVSYYEGWFPLYRPVKERSIFILFGISILLLIVAITQFLRMNGVELKLVVPLINIDWLDFGAVKGYLIGGAVVGGVFVGIGLSRGWF